MNLDTIIETNFKTISVDANLGEILKKGVAKSTRNIFPIVNDEKEFLGIILLDDIRNIMFETSLYESTKVADLMHSAPDVIDYDKDSMQKIMKKLVGINMIFMRVPLILLIKRVMIRQPYMVLNTTIQFYLGILL